jgi:hypothetical protein
MSLPYCKQTMLCLKTWWLKTSVIYYWTFNRVLVVSKFLGFYHVSYKIFKTLDPQHNVSCVPNSILSFGLYVLLDASQTQRTPSCSKRLWFKTIVQRDHPNMVSNNNVFISIYFFLVLRVWYFYNFGNMFLHVSFTFHTGLL